MKDKIINVGVLGCTGAVGQKLISLLSSHPFFKVTECVASEHSAGMKYGDRVNWKQPVELPEEISNIVIKSLKDPLEAKILFSGLDSSIAGEAESDYAARGHVVVSNSRNHRMDRDVPLLIPEINADRLSLVEEQETFRKSGGFIVTNPNGSTIVLALALHSIYRKFGLDKVMVTTMQAVSGAGYPGVPSMDILGNVVPFIDGEEAKMETEMMKIYGETDTDVAENPSFVVSASCNRVPVRDGHLMSISFSTKKKATAEEIIRSFEDYPSLGLNLSPEKVVQYLPQPDRPQHLLDVDKGHGMTVSVGRLRPCRILDWKMSALAHNTVRGAAGASILNAEMLVKAGYIK